MISQLPRLFNRLVPKKSSEIIVYQVLAFLATFTLSILLARFFGPEGKGRFDLFLVFVTVLVEIVHLGAGSGLLMILSQQKIPLGRVHGTAILIAVGLSLTTIGLNLFFPSLALEAFRGLNQEWLFWGTLLTLPMLYKNFWTHITLGIGAVKTQNQFNALLHGLVLLIFIPFFFGESLSLESSLYLYTFLVFAAAGIMFIWMLLRDPKLGFLSSHVKSIVFYSFALYLAQAINLLHFRADQVMINWKLGASEVGIYAVSVKIAELIFFLEMAFVSIHWSQIFNPEKFHRSLFVSTLKRHSLVAILAMVGMAIISPFMIHLLYGESFTRATLPLIVLLPGTAIISVAKLCSNYFTFYKKKIALILGISLTGALLNILLNYLFMFQWDFGIMGAAYASSISYTLGGLLTGLFCYRSVRKEA